MRGTRVGQAYVSVTADGSGINDEIADQFDSVDFNKIGDRHGKDYMRGLSERFRDLENQLDGVFERFGDKLSSEFDQGIETDRTADKFGKNLAKSLLDRGRLDELIFRVGEKVGHEFGSGFEQETEDGVRAAVANAIERLSKDRNISTQGLLTRILGGGGESEIPLISGVLDQAVRETQTRIDATTKAVQEAIDERVKQERLGEEKVQAIRDQYAKDWIAAEKHRAELADLADRTAEARADLVKKSNDVILRSDQDLVKAQQKLLDDLTKNHEIEVTNQINLMLSAQKQRLTAIDATNREIDSINRTWNENAAKAQAETQKKLAQFEEDRAEATLLVHTRFSEAVRKINESLNADLLKSDKDLDRSRREMLANLTEQYFTERRRLIDSDDIRTKAYEANLKEETRLFLNHVKIRSDAAKAAARAQAATPGGPSLTERYDKRVSGTSDIFGSLLGRGSRNNFLNLIGSTVKGSIDLVLSLGKIGTKVFDGLTGVGKTFSEAFKEAGENGAKFFGQAAAGFGALASKVGKSGPGALIALGVAMVSFTAAAAIGIVVLSALVSVMSALVAIVVALTSAIVTALVGALLVAGGALTAMAAAGGLAAAAFTSLDEEQKKLLSNSFDGVKDTFKEIGEIVAGPMSEAFESWGDNVNAALRNVIPLAEVMGTAFAEAGNLLTASLSGPGFQNFLTAMTSYLPSITTNLSAAFGSLMNGLLGMFAAVTPWVERFTKYLADAAETFSEWANGAKGQNAIADFMEDAEKAASAVWDTLKSVGGLMKDVLFNDDAQSSGVKIFRSISRAVDDMREAVQDAASDGRLKEWFDDAREFGNKAWRAIEGVWDVLKGLDDSGVLDAVGDGLEAIGDFLSLIAPYVDDAVAVLGPFVAVTLTVLASIAATAATQLFLVGSAIKGIGDAISNLPGIDRLSAILSAANKASGALNKLPGEFPSYQGPFPSSAEGSSFTAERSAPSSSRTAAPSAAYSPLTPASDAVGRAIAEAIGSDGDYGPNKNTERVRKVQATLEELRQRLAKVVSVFSNDLKKAMREATRAVGKDDARSAISDTIDALRDSIEKDLDKDIKALERASNKRVRAIERNFKNRDKIREKLVREEEKKLRKATKRLTKASRDLFSETADPLRDQRDFNAKFVKRILNGKDVERATLTDYARAREIMAARLEVANDKLEEALDIRQSFYDSVYNAARTFASILTTETQTVNGIETTSSDAIVSNLEDRLAKIKKFQENLRILVSQGLSDDAYKQLVEAGVDNGSAYVDALVAGGTGAIDSVNSLVKSIDDVSKELGDQTSSRLYDAGVTAAQGLVDGLKSMAEEIDRTATLLGTSIANALADALGLDTPAKGKKGGGKSKKSSDSEDSATGKGKKGKGKKGGESVLDSAVSGNSGFSSDSPATTNNFDIKIVTPSKNPKAVAKETINEIVGRL